MACTCLLFCTVATDWNLHDDDGGDQPRILDTHRKARMTHKFRLLTADRQSSQMRYTKNYTS